jgi:hypothetical protein
MYQPSVSAEPEASASESSEVASQTRVDEAVANPTVAAEADAAVATQADESAEAIDLAHPFRDELARAMQAAALRERVRIEARIDDDANSHVAKVRVRAGVEAEELKRLAEDDVVRIRAWCKAEVERIRAEADVQVGERRDRLEEHLGQHASIIDGEIDRVAEAVEGYRHELEVYFVGLGAVSDPSEIARLADAVPTPPDFELIRAIARADAVGRLFDLEAASASETPTVADAATDDDATLSAAGPAVAAPIEASPKPVAVIDQSPAPAIETQAAGTTPPAEAASIAERELVPVMDPALASVQPVAAAATSPTESQPSADATPAPAPSSVPDAAAELKSSGETAAISATSTTSTAAEPVAVMDPALAAKAEAEAIADVAAAADAEKSPELVTAGVAASEAAEPAASEPNAATRFLRSLTAWGSSDHGNNGHK